MLRIGIDLGGTNIVAAVVNDEYEMVGKSKTPTATPRSADEIFDDIAKVCKEAMAQAGVTIKDIFSVGIGTPGTVNKEGVIEFANNLGFVNVPAKEMLIERLGIENVYVDNDANCAALGEAQAGSGHGAKDFIAVTLGTGVGSGVIINGKIVAGVNNAGGECGHSVIVVDGEPCTCGRKGCWEAYASATALINQTKAAMEKYPDSVMHELVKANGGKVDGRTAFDAMRRGDIAGIKVVDAYVKYVACGLINLVNIFQPETICIGGGICNEGETLLRPLRRYIDSERYSVYSKIQSKIVKAELGNDAGIIGAALLGD
ncbi:ROK family protein [Eubacterium sp.]|uniref:ROK family protein n=1 Tax=Eubacterium sp. TaxID=142586 RepID=UPI0025D71E66|nr:ROK family protein [Eubacterium sp.]MDY3811901.1 ROK family protein [Eubacterium sp.]MDY5242972.1 ROK family protein [Eubacterium sp.]